ncbi:MAG: hypothetical protein OEZ34_03040, partial [Spirochaetia bacterium]|nr:hypothetical protein [Spirochaetia bacterium]
MRHFNISNYFHHVFIKSIILILALFTVSACTKKFPENNWINLLFLLDTVLNPPTEPTTPAVVSATLSTTTVIVSEEQTVPSASFTVVLDTAVQSGQTVTIPVTGIAAEGLVSSPLDAAWVTGPINLTFDDTNWNVPQTVFVKGVDTDLTQDASSFTQFTVTLGTVTTTDSNYTDFDPPDVLAFNLDNDTPGNAGVTIVPSSGLFTSEPAETATFGIVLNKQPAAASTVSITLASGDLTEGDITTPASKTLTFSTANWNVPQEVTVTGADDAFVDIDTPYSITQDSSTSSDPAYAALVPGSGNLPNINLFNKDNDFAGVSLDTTAVTTSETLTTQNITISLDAAPAAGTQVQIDISLIDPSEGTLTTPASIIFTDLLPGPQIVTIQGADDPNADGNIVYPLNLTINGAGTTDPAYGAVTIPSVSVTNTDDETAGITVTPVTAGILPEDGTSTATFDISLNTEPLFPVTVNVYSSDTSEAAINLAAALTFDAVCPGVTC